MLRRRPSGLHESPGPGGPQEEVQRGAAGHGAEGQRPAAEDVQGTAETDQLLAQEQGETRWKPSSMVNGIWKWSISRYMFYVFSSLILTFNFENISRKQTADFIKTFF